MAQCLEYDIAGQGKTIDDALYDCQRMLCVHVVACKENGIEPLEGLSPAPERYHKLFQQAKVLEADPPRFRMPKGMPPPWMQAERAVRLCG